MHPVGVGAVDGVAHDRDQFDARCRCRDPTLGITVEQVERCALAARLRRLEFGEQIEVVLSPPDPLLPAMGITGTAVERRWRVATHEVLGLLRVAQDELRVLSKASMECGRPSLRGPDDQEVRPARCVVQTKSWAFL